MRVMAITSAKGLRARAIAGTYVVLIAWDCDFAYTQGLLGFAIKRTDSNGNERWLPALKRFDVPPSGQPDEATTHRHPIQKFHWGDYTTRAGNTYRYEVHAMRGTAAALIDDDHVVLDVTCERPERVGANGHAVHFNRSAAASQAFANHFPNLPAGDVDDPAARKWLSRGLAESLEAFIDDTKPGEGLHLFVYEFAKLEFAAKLKAARDRGVKLQILHDAIDKGDGKGPIHESRPLLNQFGLDGVAKGRTGDGLAISHNKFMVRTAANGDPLAVWTGSTNWTDAGIYAQTNVGHAMNGRDPAATYLAWHQAIWNDPSKSASASRTVAMALTPLPPPPPPAVGTVMVLSPRRSTEAVTRCAEAIAGAESIVCFTAPFALHDDIEDALIDCPAQVYGLLNNRGVVKPELWQAPNTSLAPATALKSKTLLRDWQDKMLARLRAEGLHHSGVFIHTKLILIDPLSDHPTVIVGSANFSNNSSKNNDENQLFIYGETEVADVYIGEFMRMFDHYYFRSHVVEHEATASPGASESPFLDATDGWAKRYFNGGQKEKGRTAFF